jgi:hypothetical protein
MELLPSKRKEAKPVPESCPSRSAFPKGSESAGSKASTLDKKNRQFLAKAAGGWDSCFSESR